MQEYVKPQIEGLCFTYYPNKNKKVNQNKQKKMQILILQNLR